MTLHANNAGTWTKVKKVFAKQGTTWTEVQKGFVKQGGAWVQFFAAEIVATIAANVNNLNLSTLFTAGDWASDTKKRVVINSGVIIAATAVSVAALTTGAGLGGLLTIENAGDIRGAGGAANSGAGGHAVIVSTANVTINNTGAIRGGGGGGGRGGTGGVGGPGQYTAQEGPAYALNSYMWYAYRTSGGVSTEGTRVYWAGSLIYSSGSKFTGSVAVGGITYYTGALDHQDTSSGGGSYPYSNNKQWYQIYRQYPVGTSGGAGGGGGNGGTGQGGNVAQTAGSPGAGGAAGGPNAGAGGSGGYGNYGGTWGQAGYTGAVGNTGASGNVGGGGAGSAGAVGGAAGYAIAGVARTLINTGTIQGAT